MIKVITLTVGLGVLRCIAASPDDLFAQFKKGDFFQREMENGQLVTSGWEMKSEDGKIYHRSLLNRQVEELVEQGPQVVPASLKHLQHEHMHIRYIAAETLRRVTKLNPTWYNFGTPGETFNGNKSWSSDAIMAWRKWYESTKKEEAEQDITPDR